MVYDIKQGNFRNTVGRLLKCARSAIVKNNQCAKIKIKKKLNKNNKNLLVLNS